MTPPAILSPNAARELLRFLGDKNGPGRMGGWAWVSLREQRLPSQAAQALRDLCGWQWAPHCVSPHTDSSQGLAHSRCSLDYSHRIAGCSRFLHYELDTDREGTLRKDWKTSLSFHSQARVILGTQPGLWCLRGSEQYTKPEFRGVGADILGCY